MQRGGPSTSLRTTSGRRRQQALLTACCKMWGLVGGGACLPPPASPAALTQRFPSSIASSCSRTVASTAIGGSAHTAVFSAEVVPDRLSLGCDGPLTQAPVLPRRFMFATASCGARRLTDRPFGSSATFRRGMSKFSIGGQQKGGDTAKCAAAGRAAAGVHSAQTQRRCTVGSATWIPMTPAIHQSLGTHSRNRTYLIETTARQPALLILQQVIPVPVFFSTSVYRRRLARIMQ